MDWRQTVLALVGPREPSLKHTQSLRMQEGDVQPLAPTQRGHSTFSAV